MSVGNFSFSSMQLAVYSPLLQWELKKSLHHDIITIFNLQSSLRYNFRAAPFDSVDSAPSSGRKTHSFATFIESLSNKVTA